MYEYRLKEKFLGQTVIFPGRGFARLTYEMTPDQMEYLYSINHPSILRMKKKVKKEEIITPEVNDKPESTD